MFALRFNEPRTVAYSTIQAIAFYTTRNASYSFNSRTAFPKHIPQFVSQFFYPSAILQALLSEIPADPNLLSFF
jgi:hypothetical protein